MELITPLKKYRKSLLSNGHSHEDITEDAFICRRFGRRFDVVELVMALEEEFDRRFRDAEKTLPHAEYIANQQG